MVGYSYGIMTVLIRHGVDNQIFIQKPVHVLVRRGRGDMTHHITILEGVTGRMCRRRDAVKTCGRTSAILLFNI